MSNLLSRSGLISDRPVSSTVRVVAETLYARILSEQYPLDSRLPSERSLASELGVARNTVREALDILAEQKIIDRRAGSGSFVVYRPDGPSEEETADPGDEASRHSTSVSRETGPLELQVMRGILEPEMVRLAVIHMSPREVEELGEVLSRMEAVKANAEDYFRLEEEFLMQIAKGTGNPLFIACYRLVIDVRRRNVRSAQRKMTLSPKRIDAYRGRFNSLFNAIALRDIESAVEYVKIHLVDEQRAFMREA